MGTNCVCCISYIYWVRCKLCGYSTLQHDSSHDKTKNFKLMEEYAGEVAQSTLSDVIYHLIEDDVF